jgi:hypothetical protein
LTAIAQGLQQFISNQMRIIMTQTLIRIAMRHVITFAPQVSADTKKFSGVAYSGGLIPGFGHLGDVAIDLSDVQLPRRAFALLDHDLTARAGWAEFELRDNALHVSGQLLDTQAGREIEHIAAGGGTWQLSVGLTSSIIPASRKRKTVNGQELELDHILENPIIREVSFVSAGADPNTSVQLMSVQENKELQLELAQRRSEYIMSKFPNATPEQVVIVGSLSRQVFDTVMSLAQPAKAKPATNLSAVTAPTGGKRTVCPEGVDPERHALFLRASEIATEQKMSFIDALKAAQAEEV